MNNRDRVIARGGGLAVVLAFLAVWGGWFIYRTSFIANDGKRYFCLFDDAMISMTYARNLVEGYGLNWSKQGAPVEGFTHPLWTFLMIPANLLPLPLESRSLAIQILSLLLIGASAVAARRLVLRHFATEAAPFGLPAAVLTAFYYPLSYWALMGMETAFQALLAILAVHLALDVTEEGRERHMSLWLVCAAAYLLRMDMLPMAVAVQVYVFARRGVRPVLAARRWWLGLGLFLAVALGYSLFRWFYFHDVLPNTYYLKLTGVALPVRILKGLQVLSTFLQNHLLVILPVGLATVPLMRRNPRLILPAALFSMYCAYSVYVGGDAWEDMVRTNRYIAFVMPLLFVLLNAAVNEVLEAWSRLRRFQGLPGPVPGAWQAAAFATVAAFLVVNGLVLSSKQEESWRNLLVTERPPAVVAGWAVLDQLRTLRIRVEPGALVASAWAGIPAYFTDYRMIDVLGYNDRRIARMHSQMHLNDDNYMLFRPGHNKFSLGMMLRRRPDAFFQYRAHGRLEQQARRMTRAGYRLIDELWLRKDSPKIRWPEGREPRADRKARRPKPAA